MNGWRLRMITRTTCGVLLVALSQLSFAQRAYVAVATNFKLVADELATSYAHESGHEIVLISGSTGKLYTQIINGAPFELFLAADQVRPARLVKDQLGLADTLATYTLGRLSLVSRNNVDAHTLQNNEFRSIAIANPKLAPYGTAAMQVFSYLGIHDAMEPKIVLGENVGQAYALVATGNAETALVADTLISKQHNLSRWLIPSTYHDPIRQDLVLLTQGADNIAARGFMAFVLARHHASDGKLSHTAKPDL